MKKWTSTALGGAPVFDDDLLSIFNSEIWSCIQAILSPFDADTEGIIVSGCTVSGTGPYNISSGFVYLNGEFMLFPGATGITFSSAINITPKTPTNDVRTFADSTTATVAVDKQAEINVAPGSGQYISFHSATDPDDRRWSAMVKNSVISDQPIRTKVISMTLWNMNTTQLKTYAHGLSSASKIISVRASIFLDGTGTVTNGGIAMRAIDLDMADAGAGTDAYRTGTKWGCVRGWNDTAVELWANPYRFFGTDSLLTGSGFRGYLYITYMP